MSQATIYDERTQRYLDAKDAFANGGKFYVQIHANKLTWPKVCACCLGDAETNLRASTTKSSRNTTSTTWWDVPHCLQCAGHARHSEESKKCGIAAVVTGFFATLPLLGFLNDYLWIPLLLLLFTGALAYWSAELSGRAKRAKKNCCGDVGPGVEFQGSHGSARDFIFSNSSYLSEFLDANPRKSRSDIRRV